jgi:hypothetical protein
MPTEAGTPPNVAAHESYENEIARQGTRELTQEKWLLNKQRKDVDCHTPRGHVSCNNGQAFSGHSWRCLLSSIIVKEREEGFS